MKKSCISSTGQISRLKELKVSNRFWQAIKDLINCQLKKYTKIKPAVKLKKLREGKV